MDMMTEHVHEWHLGSHPANGHINAMCENPDCWENLSTQDILRRLNAVEQLNNQDASFLSGFALHYATDHPEGIGMWTVEKIVELGVKAASYAIVLEGE
jgi:hypothetical protein